MTMRSSYSTEQLAAAHGIDDIYPALMTVAELRQGRYRPTGLKKVSVGSEPAMKVTITMFAESVYSSMTSRDLKKPAVI